MTVKELIKELNEIENQDLEVKYYDIDFSNNYSTIDIVEIYKEDKFLGKEFVKIY